MAEYWQVTWKQYQGSQNHSESLLIITLCVESCYHWWEATCAYPKALRLCDAGASRSNRYHQRMALGRLGAMALAISDPAAIVEPIISNWWVFLSMDG